MRWTAGYAVNEANHEKTNRLQNLIKKQGHDFTITPVALPVNVADDAGERERGSSPKNSFALAERIASVFGKEVVWVTSSGPFFINGVVVPGR